MLVSAKQRSKVGMNLARKDQSALKAESSWYWTVTGSGEGTTVVLELELGFGVGRAGSVAWDSAKAWLVMAVSRISKTAPRCCSRSISYSQRQRGGRRHAKAQDQGAGLSVVSE